MLKDRILQNCVFGALLPLLANCAFVDHLSERFGVSMLLGNSNSQQASMAPTVPTRERERAPAPIPKIEPKYGSCEPLEDAGFVADLRDANVFVESISVGRKNSTVSHTISINRSLNLMELSAQVSEELTRGEIPTGEYNQMKIVVKKGRVRTKKGDTWPVEIRGNTIQIDLSRDISIVNSRASKKILVTFCTERNFFAVKNGEAFPKVAFHPVIEETVNLSM